MKIGFFSFEYPLELPRGGIATYVQQAARMLAGRGHAVEVFTASPGGGPPVHDEGVLVHRVAGMDHGRFRREAAALFAASHAASPFDVIEGPDYGADAAEAVRLVPDIPLVLKLHTPSIMLLRLNYAERDWRASLWQSLRWLRHRRLPRWGYRIEVEPERRAALEADRLERGHAGEADLVSAPARSILDIMSAEWSLPAAVGTVVPYPYVAREEYLRIPAGGGRTVTFIGRLEVRKGVVELAQAIPAIRQAHPGTRFRFVGATEPSPVPGVEMDVYLKQLLGPNVEHVTFDGSVLPRNIPGILADASVCVYPSAWENFPNVCLEAMAAGRAVIGSSAGGMADMLAGGAGVLIPPGDPRLIADAVIALLGTPEQRESLGQAARRKLLHDYAAERIATLQEESYRVAIERRRAKGPRALAG